ncbi:NYN domain-containing protein [Burkholderia sp. WSM2230]|uniref:NYN domain-containing protein n=1 Tax=Burkholderia sp. WSM2230 TaxID=944435 RepID=UPI0004708A4B|nr:NYN domain-containing protein [Burkholderia sp. WSM2230]
MASSNETVSMALFCDFENVALGVRDAKYDKFDIKLVLERLLLKGSIVVKKAYCDWDRYKSFKGAMHEANFELIEIPHVRQSGKNSADIRLVVDALDLCYTKSHVNTFVIISGDSDFSPLVSKLRENAKQVIGVGVQQSTSDLLIANCDEFFFYDDLVRESQRAVAKRESSRQKNAQPTAKASQDEEKSRNKEDLEKRRTKAIEIAVQTFDALASERGDSGKIWASVLKNAIKRRKPDFNETYYGFRAFGNLLEEAHARGLLEFGRDEKSGAYVYRSTASNVVGENVGESGAEQTGEPAGAPVDIAEEAGQLDALHTAGMVHTETGSKQDSRRRGRGDPKRGASQQAARGGAPEAARDAAREGTHEAAREVAHQTAQEAASEQPGAMHAHAPTPEVTSSALPQPPTAEPGHVAGPADLAEISDSPRADATEPKRRKQREPRQAAAKKSRKSAASSADDTAQATPSGTQPPTTMEEKPAARKNAARKTASTRNRQPRKTKGDNDTE